MDRTKKEEMDFGPMFKIKRAWWSRWVKFKTTREQRSFMRMTLRAARAQVKQDRITSMKAHEAEKAANVEGRKNLERQYLNINSDLHKRLQEEKVRRIETESKTQKRESVLHDLESKIDATAVLVKKFNNQVLPEALQKMINIGDDIEESYRDLCDYTEEHLNGSLTSHYKTFRDKSKQEEKKAEKTDKFDVIAGGMKG